MLENTTNTNLPILPERIINILNNAKLNTADAIFFTAPLSFQQLGLTEADIDLTRQHYAANTFSGFRTASAALQSAPPRITFGCAALDRLTGNGLPTRGLTELAGAAGSGKSQLCLQLALMVQLPRSMGGLERGAAIVCTERFASPRLFAMIAAMPQLFGSRMRAIPFSSQVYVQQVPDAAGLLRCVRHTLPELMAGRAVGLVCVDSVAAVFRTETDDVRGRATDMRTMARALRRLSERYGCAVVCVNQMTTVPDEGDGRLVPCLGLAWANLVTLRLQVSREEGGGGGADGGGAVRRSVEVVFSPELAPGRAEFAISAEGVVDVEE